eukprot:42174_1
MEDLIKFNTLLHRLETDEYDIIVNTVLNMLKKQKSLFTQIMFDYFLKQLNTHSEQQETRLNTIELNQTMLNLINQRKKKKIQSNIDVIDSKTDNIFRVQCIDELPNPILQYVSYFFRLQDQSIFERCSRTIFVATRTPKLLYHVPIGQLQKYMESFNTVEKQKLCISKLTNVHELGVADETAKYIQLRKWNNIQYLYLIDLKQSSATTIMNSINWNSIQSLNIWSGEHRKADIILNILHHCTNLSRLDMSAQEEFEDLDLSKINHINNLKYLSIEYFSDVTFVENMLKQNSDVLETLSMDCTLPISISVKFKKLTTLIAQHMYGDSLVNILENTRKLEILKIVNDFKLDEFYGDIDISKIIEAVLKVNTLNDISLNMCASHFPSIVANIYI